MSLIANPISLVEPVALFKHAIREEPSTKVTNVSVNRVLSYQTLKTPLELRDEIPVNPSATHTIDFARQACANVIAGKDDKLIVVVGPCSIHDPEQALHYARALKSVMSAFPDLIIIMRSYFEKPRTTVGWKGLINDPNLDGSNQISHGLTTARKLLHDLTSYGVPVAVEVLDTITPQYLSDFISWGAIGARTTESQLHREVSSGLPHPVAFKNSTDGSTSVAMHSLLSASSPHAFLGIDATGQTSIIKTVGNQDVHVILRGGNTGPNYSSDHVQKTKAALLKNRPKFNPAIMIDCSHANSEKNYRNQSKVVDSICEQLREGERSLMGVMIESNIHEGRQDITAKGLSALEYGISVTDACVGFETTVKMLSDLQLAVLARRERLCKSSVPLNKVI
ncbi:hypothetical protein CROQUDRAFT_656273 [Cronartium quercuum f. sp. fusiforme G11]|uniref:Phospho-2-dehydro-3-deoxyheptonate aldolase n=1 Tax=Cronartium quercuum f. sp. fusiforme G11 TaxID=708437 RepID=A0A9P6NJW7_9BASI|nr:hypothetical protein CROQUDRAFT_656273 [Cronartium quercuum f. sp. fusiforme G11]